MTNLGLVGDPYKVGNLDYHKISSVQNFRPLGKVEAYNSYNGAGRELVS